MSLIALMCLNFLSMFSMSLLKAYQVRTIVSGSRWTATRTSFLITTGDVCNVLLAVGIGWWAILSAGLGGMCGIYSAMALHDRLNKK